MLKGNGNKKYPLLIPKGFWNTYVLKKHVTVFYSFFIRGICMLRHKRDHVLSNYRKTVIKTYQKLFSTGDLISRIE